MVRDAEQAVEPHRGECLGEDDEQLQDDPDPRERLVLDQPGHGRAGIAVGEKLGPDQQEAGQPGDGDPEVEQSGHSGGTDLWVHADSL
jgi:hypothetical protein